jgi:RNA polymerase sigma-B factor
MTITAEPQRVSAAEQRQTTRTKMLREARRASPVERQRLLDEVIVANLEVARSIAGRYRNRGIAGDDLEQVACLALVRAANRFDPSRADDFLTFAVPTIRGENRRHFRDHGWTVRPPRSLQELQAAINGDAADPATRGAGDDSDERVATRLGVAAAQVREARAAQGCFAPTSLDAPRVGDREPLGATLVDDEFDDHAAVEARVILRTLVKELKPRERLILYLRFVEGLTQAAIGATQMQVSRLLNRILARMRQRALGSGTASGVAADIAS